MECSVVRIALPPDPGQSSTFPFHELPETRLRISAVRSRMEKGDERPLHAKWIEVATPNGTITLTGKRNDPHICALQHEKH